LHISAGSKLAQAISKGTDAINKLVFSGEVEELRELVCPQADMEVEEYLLDDKEIDFSKVPNVNLPPPLPSSKFAQNPELLKSLNRGGKRKFDQLIGWSDGGASDRISKMHQPVFSGVITEDSQSNDTDLRFSKSNLVAESNSFHSGQDEDHRRSGLHDLSRSNRGDEDLRFNMSTGPGRPSSVNEFDSRGNNFADKDFRNFLSSKSLDDDDYDEREHDNASGRWDDEEADGSRGKLDSTFGNNFDKRDNGVAMGMGNNLHGPMAGIPHLPNHHNMQNINPNMPPPIPSLVPHPNMSQHPSMQGKPPHPGMPGIDGPMPPHMMPPHPNMHPGFGPNGPPPGGFGPNFRPPPPNSNFGPNHFRPNPMLPFGPNQGPPPFGNNFQGPPNFRGPNVAPMNFDRPSFGPNFRGQTPQGQLNNFNSNFGNFGKNGPNRGISRGGSDMGRGGYNNRGRGRDNDQSRGGRGRDNY